MQLNHLPVHQTMPSALTVKLLLLFGSIVAASSGRAAIFVSLPQDSALTLGSGVDVTRPQEGLPPCFQLTPPKTDVPNTQSYDVLVKAVNSTEEVNRERRKRGSVSGSYGAVSAKLAAWSNEQSKDSRSSLFIIIEARYVGPRTMSEPVTALPTVAGLLASGEPAKIVERCGTHVATVEHRGQTLRLVLNLSNIEHSAKQEIAIKFGAKAKFGMGGGKVSGSYSSTVAKLATENRLEFAMEGSGTAPALASVTALFRTKAGDLSAVADALGQLLASASVGNVGSFVPYGYTLQPIGLFTDRVPVGNSGVAELDQLEQLQDLQLMLDSQRANARRQLETSGLPSATRERLQKEADDVVVMRNGVAKDAAACRWEKSDSGKACADMVWKWRGELAKSRGISAKVVLAESELRLETLSPYTAAGTLVVVVNGQDFPLDSFKVIPGLTRTRVARASGTGINQKLFTEAPLTVNLLFLLPDLQTHKSRNDVESIHVGCLGAAAFGPPPAGPGVYMFQEPLFGVNPPNAPSVSADSVCSTGGMWLPSMGGPYAPPLMPAGLRPTELPAPTGPIALKLHLVDAYGFETSHLIAEDLTALLAGLK